MNTHFLYMLVFLLSGALYAQETDVLKDDVTKQTDSLPTKIIQVVDSIAVQKFDGDLPTTIVATRTKDSVVFDLKDNALARQVDSLWLATLYKNDLFEEIYVDEVDGPSGNLGKEHIFRGIIDKYTLIPHEILVVGDKGPSELTAGNNIGAKTAQILRPKIEKWDGADYYITSLCDIKRIL